MLCILTLIYHLKTSIDVMYSNIHILSRDIYRCYVFQHSYIIYRCYVFLHSFIFVDVISSYTHISSINVMFNCRSSTDIVYSYIHRSSVYVVFYIYKSSVDVVVYIYKSSVMLCILIFLYHL